jgi:hypothetical protein
MEVTFITHINFLSLGTFILTPFKILINGARGGPGTPRDPPPVTGLRPDVRPSSADKQPPDDFHLQPMREKVPAEVSIALSEATMKPFSDLGVYGDVDIHAAEVSIKNLKDRA